MNPLIEAVSSALDLLSDKKRWIQNCRASAVSGDHVWPKQHRVPPKDPKAVCWCISGAVEKFLPGDRKGEAKPYLDTFTRAFIMINEECFPPEQYNDTHTYNQSYAALRRTYEFLVLRRAQSTEITNTKTK